MNKCSGCGWCWVTAKNPRRAPDTQRQSRNHQQGKANKGATQPGEGGSCVPIQHLVMKKMPMLRRGPHTLRMLVGFLFPVLRVRAGGKKKGEKDLFCFFPIRHPGCPGPWWIIRAGKRLCGLGAAAWLPRREGGATRAKSPVGRDEWRSWGVGEGGISYWAVVCMCAVCCCYLWTGPLCAACGRCAVIISPPVPSAVRIIGIPRPYSR